MYVNRVINYDDPKLKPRTGCHQFKLHPECPEIATYIYICIQGFVDRCKYIYITGYSPGIKLGVLASERNYQAP